jgi:hypothetical protein
MYESVLFSSLSVIVGGCDSFTISLLFIRFSKFYPEFSYSASLHTLVVLLIRNGIWGPEILPSVFTGLITNFREVLLSSKWCASLCVRCRSSVPPYMSAHKAKPVFDFVIGLVLLIGMFLIPFCFYIFSSTGTRYESSFVNQTVVICIKICPWYRMVRSFWESVMCMQVCLIQQQQGFSDCTTQYASHCRVVERLVSSRK